MQQAEEVAGGTLEELGRQDAQLDKIQKDQEQVGLLSGAISGRTADMNQQRH